MLANELKVGDIFTVNQRDPESPVRVCLEVNAEGHVVKFGFPNNEKFWCHMGGGCEVTVIEKAGPATPIIRDVTQGTKAFTGPFHCVGSERGMSIQSERTPEKAAEACEVLNSHNKKNGHTEQYRVVYSA